MPCAFSPAVTPCQNGELFNEPAPVTSNACVPYPWVMASNLASVPEPNSMRGKRERKKTVMRTGSFQVNGERMVATLPTECLLIN